ncbi:MAG: aldolase/citrate lyase family protein [Bacteroidota bacterium]|nr:aldolase/citrate lyase family protein [Bacteroidota bacterium]
MGKIVTCGNQGERIRSDCQVILELTDAGGIDIQLISKVKSLYEDSIITLTKEIFSFFNIANARIQINDSGALPHVIAARLESAIKLLIDSDKEYLPDFHPDNKRDLSTPREKHRISRLYIPGNSPELMINAGLHHPDGIILDLEDAVAPDKKHEARFMVRNALRAIYFHGAERMVRINQIPGGIADLDYIIPHKVNLLLIPKCEYPEQIKQVNKRIGIISTKCNLNHKIWLMPIIESAKGIINAYDIATSANNIVAMAIGLEDYTADIGVSRTREGTESFVARNKIVIACKAAGIQAIDSVFSDINDLEALYQTALQSKALGFAGMGCIHPRQIKPIREAFTPKEEEIDKAKKIVTAFEEAQSKGVNVVVLGSKMIDPAVVKQALNTIALAISMDRLERNWREQP